MNAIFLLGCWNTNNDTYYKSSPATPSWEPQVQMVSKTINTVREKQKHYIFFICSNETNNIRYCALMLHFLDQNNWLPLLQITLIFCFLSFSYWTGWAGVGVVNHVYHLSDWLAFQGAVSTLPNFIAITNNIKTNTMQLISTFWINERINTTPITCRSHHCLTES